MSLSEVFQEGVHKIQTDEVELQAFILNTLQLRTNIFIIRKRSLPIVSRYSSWLAIMFNQYKTSLSVSLNVDT